MTYSAEIAAFAANPASGAWSNLPFFGEGRAAAICAQIDRRAAQGEQVLPPPGDVLNALRLTPLEAVKVVILGQDPYPTPGHAHGLAFSYRGEGRLPASLKNIFKEMQADLGYAPSSGDLTHWASQGVLLTNAAFTVTAGAAGAHAKLGWEHLVEDIINAVSASRPHVVFILWGGKAQARRPLIDETRHLVIATAHPSPLSARTGFFGSRPFSRTNDWLAGKGLTPIEWV